MHLGALCMQLRAPVSFLSLLEGPKMGLFHLIDKIADFLHNKLFFSDSPRGICIIIGRVCRLAQTDCVDNNTFLSLWECSKMGFFSLRIAENSQRLKKVLLSTQSVCARLRTLPIIMQIPRGYQKKKFIV